MNNNKLNRHYGADVCRICATFGVILIHTSGPFFYQYGQIDTLDWLSAHFMNSFVRCSVPLFVMLSGALLLKSGSREVSINRLLKRVSRLAIPLCVWSLFYMLFLSYHTGSSVDITSMLYKPAMYHLTFIYTLIGVYLLIPILQVIYDLLVHRKDYQIYFFLFWFIVNCIPVFISIPFISSPIGTNYSGWGGYFLIGGLIANYANNIHHISTKHLTIAKYVYLFSVAATFIFTWILSAQSNLPIQTVYEYFSPTVFFASVSAFIVLINIKKEHESPKIVQWVSDITFPVYFMHVVILDIVNINLISPSSSIPVVFQILIVSTISFLVCLIIASVLRIIPKSKTLFG
ncbi:acyltransferase family protein [Vibrio makurazakiensis]|uniref:acyltransferase n=1 Tax=Vibrio makurazakiensis TaxID=2910250 RepID=UPI003D0BE416